ncbi:MAG: 3-oxoacyl-[acyl-carrier-protein] reductase [Proteobacteria bacterium]|nr:3-oxoacyl-[acyl-carrier-protein] reductase [Pseudomonadota bacterium]
MPDQIKRTVVVTGGSRGIGRAICLVFANPDTRIFFNYSRSEEDARQTEEVVSQAGGYASGLQIDVSSLTDVARFFKTILDETGRVDILVNNAGIARDALIVRMSEADWDAVLNTNLKGTFNCTKLAAKAMLKQRYGRIINITSVVGVSGNPGQANYVASKAGIIGLTKSVARELATRNITVNAVAPGYIETEMTNKLSDKAKSEMVGLVPAGRAGKPSEVADVVEFLASEKASYITGQVIHVSGGMYI